MTPEIFFCLASLMLFSLADLRYRVAPGMAMFFLAAVFFAAPAEPLRVGLVILTVGWGWLRGPSILVIPALFSPSTWAVLLTGAGVRRGMVGEVDLLALGGVACLFGWPATVLALIGLEVWRWCWKKWRSKVYQPDTFPALPGIFLGFVMYLLWRSLGS